MESGSKKVLAGVFFNQRLLRTPLMWVFYPKTYPVWGSTNCHRPCKKLRNGQRHSIGGYIITNRGGPSHEPINLYT